MEKKSKKKIMKQNSGFTVSNLRTTGLPISYPSLYQLSYNSMFAPLKLQYINWKLNDFGHFYALQWLDGSTVVVAVPKNAKIRGVPKLRRRNAKRETPKMRNSGAKRPIFNLI
jgi:hypothetical protein